jgi:hypothetical protein
MKFWWIIVHLKRFLESLRTQIMNLRIESYEGSKKDDYDRLSEHGVWSSKFIENFSFFYT